jgi:hypothetical protein
VVLLDSPEAYKNLPPMRVRGHPFDTVGEKKVSKDMSKLPMSVFVHGR